MAVGEIKSSPVYILDWKPNTQYVKNTIFLHEDVLYRTSEKMLSPLVFDAADYELLNPCEEE